MYEAPATALSSAAPRLAFGSTVAGLGTALPATVVGNAEVAERIGKTYDWIVQRTGIHERRVLRPEERLSGLAAQAGAAALEDAGLSARLVLQIHDELLFEAPESEAERASEIVVREMAGAYDLDPPLAVDVGVGANWLAAK